MMIYNELSYTYYKTSPLLFMIYYIRSTFCTTDNTKINQSLFSTKTFQIVLSTNRQKNVDK